MLSAFDLDRTLLKKNSSAEFCKYLYKKGIFSFFSVVHACLYYIQHIYFGLTLAQLHQKSFNRLLKGLSIEFLEEQVEDFLNENLDSLFYPPALERIQKARQNNHYILILSAAPSFLVKSIAQRLKVDDWKGSEYGIDKERKLCEIASIVQGKEKSCYLALEKERLGLRKEDVIAYSDSHLDLPFLYAAGRQIVVNPNHKLKKIASKLGWEKI